MTRSNNNSTTSADSFPEDNGAAAINRTSTSKMAPL